MRQIRIVRDYNGALGRFARGIPILLSPGVADQLVQDGYAEYADPEPKAPLPPAPSPTGKGEEDGPEAAVELQGENTMKPKAKARG